MTTTNTPIRHLARVFLRKPPPFADDNELVGELSSALGDQNLQVLLSRQVHVPTGNSFEGKMLQAPPWSINMTHESVDLEYRHAPGNVFETSEFVATASIVLGLIMAKSKRKSTRLALISETLKSYDSDSEEDLDKLGDRLIGPPELLASTFEWDWRCAARVPHDVCGVTEVTNTIATVKRLAGQVNGVEFDGTLTSFDINTSPDNSLERFGVPEVEAFYTNSSEWTAELMVAVAQRMADG